MAEISWVVDPVTQIELLVPEWTTPESVIERAARHRAGRLLDIRLLVEWGVGWPVWGVVGGEIDAETLGLSKELQDELLQWTSFREHHLNITSGWSSSADQDTWMRRGHELEEWLQREAWDIADVRREF
ncbi:hypothetical protein [Leifsonia sp. NPDC058230]|uniref:hypothetical protein n=1 Tax=Leifsonia sp. NPDC058230 TaxID=3346391 RepID=UPI0036DC8F1E